MKNKTDKIINGLKKIQKKHSFEYGLENYYEEGQTLKEFLEQLFFPAFIDTDTAIGFASPYEFSYDFAVEYLNDEDPGLKETKEYLREMGWTDKDFKELEEDPEGEDMPFYASVLFRKRAIKVIYHDMIPDLIELFSKNTLHSPDTDPLENMRDMEELKFLKNIK
jgi:hypothetical protein